MIIIFPYLNSNQIKFLVEIVFTVVKVNHFKESMWLIFSALLQKIPNYNIQHKLGNSRFKIRDWSREKYLLKKTKHAFGFRL